MIKSIEIRITALGIVMWLFAIANIFGVIYNTPLHWIPFVLVSIAAVARTKLIVEWRTS